MAEVLVVTEQRCWVDAGGTMTGRKSLLAVESLAREVPCTVAARPTPPGDGTEALLPGHGALVLPWPSGPRDLGQGLRLLVTIWRAVGRHRAVVVYAPGLVGSLAALVTMARRRPLAVVAVGDPAESLAPEVVPGRLGAVARVLLRRTMGLVCARAAVVRYVTHDALQRRYPPGPGTVAIAGSDIGPVEVPAAPGPAEPSGQPRRVVLTVASLDQPYKGIAELIDAVGRLRRDGVEVALEVAGTGRLLPELEARGRAVLADEVTFHGHLDHAALEDAYERADLFVLPSWTEGLPRALVEAMAHGLPCVATRVGGVPELLDEVFLVPPRDVDALADAVAGLLARDDLELVADLHRERARTTVAEGTRADDAFARAVRTTLGARS